MSSITAMDHSPLTAQAVRDVAFRESFRGYNAVEVDDFLEKVASRIEALDQRLRDLSDRAERAEAKPAEPANDEAVRRTLVLAQRAADLVVSEAKTVAERLVKEAEQQAQALRAEAEAEAAALRADAAAEVDRLRTEAKDKVDLRLREAWEEGDAHLADVRASAARTLDEAAQRAAADRAAYLGEIEENLRTSRETLAEATRTAHDTTEGARRDAERMLEDSRHAAARIEADARADAEALLSGARAEQARIASESAAEVDRLVSDARARADELQVTAAREIRQVREAATAEIEARTHAADARAQEILADATAQAERLRRHAEDDAQRRRSDAEADAQRRRSEAETDAARRRAEADTAVALLRETAERETAAMSRHAEQTSQQLIGDAQAKADEILHVTMAAAAQRRADLEADQKALATAVELLDLKRRSIHDDLRQMLTGHLQWLSGEVPVARRAALHLDGAGSATSPSGGATGRDPGGAEGDVAADAVDEPPAANGVVTDARGEPEPGPKPHAADGGEPAALAQPVLDGSEAQGRHDPAIPRAETLSPEGAGPVAADTPAGPESWAGPGSSAGQSPLGDGADAEDEGAGTEPVAFAAATEAVATTATAAEPPPAELRPIRRVLPPEVASTLHPVDDVSPSPAGAAGGPPPRLQTSWSAPLDPATFTGLGGADAAPASGLAGAPEPADGSASAPAGDGRLSNAGPAPAAIAPAPEAVVGSEQAEVVPGAEGQAAAEVVASAELAPPETGLLARLRPLVPKRD